MTYSINITWNDDSTHQEIVKQIVDKLEKEKFDNREAILDHLEMSRLLLDEEENNT